MTPMPPLRVQILSTHYPHLGEHMGFRQVRRHLDPARVAWTERLVVKDRAHLPGWFRALRRLTRRRFSLPPRQYMLEDWLAERAARRDALRGGVDIIQYLDGEHSCQHLPGWLEGRPGRPRLAGLFHLPPDDLAANVDREAVRRLDAVVTICPDQADWFRAWLDPARVHLVWHGIDGVFFHPPPGGPPADGPVRVVTVGSNYRDYGTVFAVARRLAAHRDLEFHVVKRFPAGTEIPPNVRVHTGISDDALAALYRGSHLCLLPLAKATANNTLLEAMASGLPVVTSDVPGTRAYGGAVARLFPVGDAEAAAAHVLALAAEPARRRAEGAAARARALELTWDQAARGLTAVYESLARA